MGVDGFVSFFGCLSAGIIAVPMTLPRRQSARDASSGILADCTPRLALTTAEFAGGSRGDLLGRFRNSGVEILAVDAPGEAPARSGLPEPRRADIAFLQYTSGST